LSLGALQAFAHFSNDWKKLRTFFQTLENITNPTQRLFRRRQLGPELWQDIFDI